MKPMSCIKIEINNYNLKINLFSLSASIQTAIVLTINILVIENKSQMKC